MSSRTQNLDWQPTLDDSGLSVQDVEGQAANKKDAAKGLEILKVRSGDEPVFSYAGFSENHRINQSVRFFAGRKLFLFIRQSCS